MARGENIIASDCIQSSLDAFTQIGAEAVTENKNVVQKSDVIFIGVKPNVVPTVLDEVKKFSEEKLFVSVAMGITLEGIESRLPKKARVIRVMPNTPAVVQAAASVFVRGSEATENDAKLVRTLLASVGTCDEVTEYMMDPVTG